MITKLQSGVAKDLLMKGKITMSKRIVDLFIPLFSQFVVWIKEKSAISLRVEKIIFSITIYKLKIGI